MLFMHKPVTFEAIQYDGMNAVEMIKWADGMLKPPVWFWLERDGTFLFIVEGSDPIATRKVVPVRHWVLLGGRDNNTLTVCDPVTFAKLYDAYGA